MTTENIEKRFAVGNTTPTDVAFRVMWNLSWPVVRGGWEFIEVARVLDCMYSGNGGPINHGNTSDRCYRRPSWATNEPKENVRDEDWFTSQAEREYSFREYFRHYTNDEFWTEVQNLLVEYKMPVTIATLASVSDAYRLGLMDVGIEVHGPWNVQQNVHDEYISYHENPYKVGDRRRTIFKMAQRVAEWEW